MSQNWFNFFNRLYEPNSTNIFNNINLNYFLGSTYLQYSDSYNVFSLIFFFLL